MSKTIKKNFPVTDMACAACAARVEKVLGEQKGVCSASVNFANSTANVEYDPSVCTPEELKTAVEDAGYGMLIQNDENTVDSLEQKQIEKYKALKKRTVLAIESAPPSPWKRRQSPGDKISPDR